MRITSRSLRQTMIENVVLVSGGTVVVEDGGRRGSSLKGRTGGEKVIDFVCPFRNVMFYRCGFLSL